MFQSYKAVISDYKWENKKGEALELKYSFKSNKKNEMSSTIQPLSFLEQETIKKALKTWENIANIKFIEVFTDKNADIVIRKGQFGDKINGNTTIERDPYNHTSLLTADIIYNSKIFSSPEPGQEGFKTILHEIGHALGLKHTQKHSEYDVAPFLENDQDNQIHTIMSYNNVNKLKKIYKAIPLSYSKNYESHNLFYPATPGVYDIAAIQELYGANLKYNSGDTTYVFKDEIKKKETFYTIWDPAGKDTIDASKTTTNNLIDLRDGSAYVSKIGNKYFSFAYGTKIENVKSGSGNDVIYGTHSNIIHTGSGEDSVFLGTGYNIIHAQEGKKEYIFEEANIKRNISISHINNFKHGDKIKVKNYNKKGLSFLTADELEKLDIRKKTENKLDQDYKFNSKLQMSGVKFEDVFVVLYGLNSLSINDIEFIDSFYG